MRILENEKEIIVDSIKQFDPQAEIYLFGSRMYDTKKGGDIDLLLFSNILSERNIFQIENKIFKK